MLNSPTKESLLQQPEPQSQGFAWIYSTDAVSMRVSESVAFLLLL